MTDIPDDIRMVAASAFTLACGKPSHEERIAVIAKVILACENAATENAARVIEALDSAQYSQEFIDWLAAAIRSQP